VKPRLILAGIPYFSTRTRDRSFQAWFESDANFPEWTTRVIWSRSRLVDLAPCWPEIEDELAHVESGPPGEGIQLLLFHKEREERETYAHRIGEFHRYRFLATNLMTLFGSPAFYTRIRDEVALEQHWRSSLRPNADKHPLLLPNPYFVTTQFLGLIWNRVRETESSDDIRQLVGALADFNNRHAKHSSQRFEFVDLAANHFRIMTHAFHGSPVRPREDWKFTYRMRDGFHYDVGPASGRGYFMIGARNYLDHVNIYPHGAIRP
jgi:hypothetical protein